MTRMLQAAKSAAARRKTSTSCGQIKERFCPVCERPFTLRRRKFKEHTDGCVHRERNRIALVFPCISDDRQRAESRLERTIAEIRKMKL